jgi:DNA primase
MSDPVSLIALGAAVGGATGKLAERTWDSAERWLRERFGSHDKKVRERARKNAADFVESLAMRVELLEREHKIDSKQIDNQTHPEFSALLQRSLLNAAQTEDKTKQDLLARLVAARLASDDETTFALASQLASDAIARSTRRQLQLMALSCFLNEIRPRTPVSPEHYRLWVQVHLRHFEDFQFKESDAYHLVAIGCASYDQACERDLEILLRFKGGVEQMETPLADLDEVDILQYQWTEGLAGIFLTSVGSLIGGLALSQLYGRDMGPPAWSK